jgi:hypothetical protein
MFETLDARVKGLRALDIGLLKWSVLFGTIIIVKLFPQLLNINYPLLIILMVACAARPVYVVWIKK